MVLGISDIPTLLVIAGIVFIFIAIVREISGYLKASIDEKKAKILGIAGIILLASGLITAATGIFLPPEVKPVPTPSPSPTATPTPTPTPTQTLTPTPTPTPPPFTPLYVPETYYPSGWMGDWGDITLDDSYTTNPHSDPICIKISYSAAKSQGEGWAGIYWQHPDSNWGDKIGGYDLTGAIKLTFWARGEKGGEKAEFKVGGITTGKYPDSLRLPASTGVVTLSDNWQQYTIDLAGKDLSSYYRGICMGHK
jgi:hypothetical protein